MVYSGTHIIGTIQCNVIVTSHGCNYNGLAPKYIAAKQETWENSDPSSVNTFCSHIWVEVFTFSAIAHLAHYISDNRWLLNIE